jgi:phage gpG-like protein
MTVSAVQVDDSKVVVSLGRFRLSLQQNEELMREIGTSQYLSVMKTFREQGSPAGSWAPLAQSTIRSDPKFYGPGHLLLAGRTGWLRNSIKVAARPGTVTIGTNVVYAAVHQFGSRDRSVGIGPQTESQSKSTVDVKARSYFRLSSELGVGSLPHAGRRKISGPRNAAQVNAKAHTRHQNIPPRPYLVFRPEDPQRIRGIVSRFIATAKQKAGLGGAE